MVEKSSGQKVEILRTNNGGDSRDFENYLKKEGIRHKYTIPKIPEQNGVAKRMDRTLIEIARSILSDSKLSKRFLTGALSISTYVWNRNPTRIQGMTLYKVWTGYEPNVKYLHVFEWSVYVYIRKDERNKMDRKGKKEIFLGYALGFKRYQFYNTKKFRVFSDREVIFNEPKSTKGRVSKNQPLVEIECHCINVNNDVNSQEFIWKSQRIKKNPDQFSEWVYIKHRLDDPLIMKEAFFIPKKNEWMKAMERKIDSLDTSKVWKFVELPSRRKAIDRKWVMLADTWNNTKLD